MAGFSPYSGLPFQVAVKEALKLARWKGLTPLTGLRLIQYQKGTKMRLPGAVTCGRIYGFCVAFGAVPIAYTSAEQGPSFESGPLGGESNILV